MGVIHCIHRQIIAEGRVTSSSRGAVVKVIHICQRGASKHGGVIFVMTVESICHKITNRGDGDKSLRELSIR